ncbi:haloacid dehalogenase-like hydrolase [Chlamydia sp. 17-3921]|uniref:haloacid dehalogenase-like hydrolase n=1 Tax=Chlamydia sp. 17-3921 TaxID=2675798 RepID=UPI00191A61FD|nr:haloacid dehalogenase-like hydrolase [Chlamydia sp. 17-3921]
MTRRCIYAFDLDKTLLRGNSSWKFYRYALLRQLFPYKSIPGCILRFLGFKFFFDLSSFYTRIVNRLLLNTPQESLFSYARDFVATLKNNDFYAPTIERLEEAFKDPFGQVVLFSSSPDFIVGPIAERLGVHLWYASYYQTESAEQVVYKKCLTGEKKAQILSYLKKICQARSHTFSDHILDLPFLLLGEEKTVVRPRGRLKKIAKKCYWNII